MITRDLEAVISQFPHQSLTALPSNHDIRVLYHRVLALAEESVEKNRTPLMISQKVVQMLYKTPSQLGREVYVAILKALCEAFDEVSSEAITWFLYAEDEVRLTFLCLAIFVAYDLTAQVQRSSHDHPSPDWLASLHRPRSAYGEALSRGPPPELCVVCTEPDQGVVDG